MKRDFFKRFLGPTGDYPNGKSAPDDAGGLMLSISTTKRGEVRLDFGTNISWLALEKPQAVELALIMLRHAGVVVDASGVTGTKP